VFRRTVTACVLVALAAVALARPAAEGQPGANTWVRLHSDTRGARRRCAVRDAPAAGTFFLWDGPESLRLLTEDEAAGYWPGLAADLYLHGMLCPGAWFEDQQTAEAMAAAAR
jgi:hypothetical protein